MKKQYSVIVGNVGTVFSGTNKKDAQAMYREYVKISDCSRGRISGEDVTLFCDDEPILEHFGALHDDY
jgi:hypothetical protein